MSATTEASISSASHVTIFALMPGVAAGRGRHLFIRDTDAVATFSAICRPTVITDVDTV